MAKKKGMATVPDEEAPIIEEKVDLRSIKISIQKVENVDPIFTATDIYIEIQHAGEYIGQSERVPVYDKFNVFIDYETQFTCNVANQQSLDLLLSCPVYFTVWQTPGEADINLYPSRSETTEDTATHVITKESISSLYEAILGVKWEEEIEEEEKPIIIDKKAKIVGFNKEEKKGESGDKIVESKDIKDKISEEKITNFNVGDAGDAVCVGKCNLDLLPFFLGEKVIAETITLQQVKIHLDDEMVTLPNLPLLSVSLKIDQRIFEEEYTQDDRTFNNLLNLTVESIYNIPECFCENVEYNIATLLPTEKLTLKPMCYTGTYKEGVIPYPEYKLWPNLGRINNFSAKTNEMIDEDVTNIKNKIGVPINPLALKSEPRITWNILIKCWLSTNASDFFKKNITRYRQWPIEIFLISRDIPSQDKKVSKDVKSKLVDSKDSAKRCVFNPQYQHLMGFVDISSILYPGVTKTRVACALRTFQQEEFTNATGYDDSYFVPKFPTTPVPLRKESAGDKKGGKGGKDPKKDKVEVAERGSDTTPEPSQPVLNEKGEPTFIILEFKLMFPFQPRRSLPDLTNELLIGIPNRSNIHSSVLNVRFATQHYRETILKLGCEINIQYQKYKQKHDNIDLMQFIKYLQENGTYQTYYTTFSRSIVIMVKEKFSYTSDFKNAYAFANYASNVYTYMQNILNTQIHELMSCNMLMCVRKNNQLSNHLFYATEAFEIGAISLANRYHLQGLNKEINKPHLWFHLAVFYFKTNAIDKAFECLKEGLALQVDHKYILLLFGIILCEKQDYYLSETTFLSMVSYHPKFITGWVCLYLFYQKRQQFEGCDFCWEKIIEFDYKNKKENIVDDEEDEICIIDGLSWTTNICNSDNLFYVTSLNLIKIGALNFADMALSTNNCIQDGIYRYYQAVILYYAKDYEHALMHLAEAQKTHGPDYAVNSLIGHCHYHLGNYTEAKEAYEFIIEAFNRPDDMHILYMNLSFIYESEEKYELARKYMVYVCKYSPTPYSWLLLGILYYKDNNYVNAEACLEESNLSDIRLPEPWAYLVLINLKFGKHWEAQQCYTQLSRFQLNNKELLEEVENEMRAHNFLDKLN